MRRRELITLLGGAVAAAWPLAAQAQQPERMRRIGVLMNAAPVDLEQQSWLGAFLKALEELGWIDGRNFSNTASAENGWSCLSKSRPA